MRGFAEPRLRSAVSLAPLAVVLLLGPGACDRGGKVEPPTVHYGEDVCARCNMIVSEERFATAYVADPGDGAIEPFVFDDIGCMFAHEKKNAGASVRGRWVHDAGDLRWIEAATAHFVRSPEIRSPMGSGILAWATRESADASAGREKGEVLDYPELQAVDRDSGLLTPPTATQSARGN